MRFPHEALIGLFGVSAASKMLLRFAEAAPCVPRGGDDHRAIGFGFRPSRRFGELAARSANCCSVAATALWAASSSDDDDGAEAVEGSSSSSSSPVADVLSDFDAEHSKVLERATAMAADLLESFQRGASNDSGKMTSPSADAAVVVVEEDEETDYEELSEVEDEEGGSGRDPSQSSLAEEVAEAVSSFEDEHRAAMERARALVEKQAAEREAKEGGEMKAEAETEEKSATEPEPESAGALASSAPEEWADFLELANRASDLRVRAKALELDTYSEKTTTGLATYLEDAFAPLSMIDEMQDREGGDLLKYAAENVARAALSTAKFVVLTLESLVAAASDEDVREILSEAAVVATGAVGQLSKFTSEETSAAGRGGTKETLALVPSASGEMVPLRGPNDVVFQSALMALDTVGIAASSVLRSALNNDPSQRAAYAISDAVQGLVTSIAALAAWGNKLMDNANDGASRMGTAGSAKLGSLEDDRRAARSLAADGASNVLLKELVGMEEEVSSASATAEDVAAAAEAVAAAAEAVAVEDRPAGGREELMDIRAKFAEELEEARQSLQAKMKAEALHRSLLESRLRYDASAMAAAAEAEAEAAEFEAAAAEAEAAVAEAEAAAAEAEAEAAAEAEAEAVEFEAAAAEAEAAVAEAEAEAEAAEVEADAGALVSEVLSDFAAEHEAALARATRAASAEAEQRALLESRIRYEAAARKFEEEHEEMRRRAARAASAEAEQRALLESRIQYEAAARKFEEEHEEMRRRAARAASAEAEQRALLESRIQYEAAARKFEEDHAAALARAARAASAEA